MFPIFPAPICSSCTSTIKSGIRLQSQGLKQQTAVSADMLSYLFDSHELSSVVVEAQVDSAKGSCPHHLSNLPIDLFPDWEALHATGCHSTSIWPTSRYTVCNGSCSKWGKKPEN